MKTEKVGAIWDLNCQADAVLAGAVVRSISSLRFRIKR